ncbi:hypothetical protein Btru_054293, partial [Bulinus truncatus]
MPPDFDGHQRVPQNTISGDAARGHNSPGPVILQDYTDRLALGQAKSLIHDNVSSSSSMTHHHGPAKQRDIMPHVEIKGYSPNTRGLAAHDQSLKRSVLGFAKSVPTHPHRPPVEEDGGDDEMYSYEDAPLLVSDYLVAASSRQSGQGPVKPSKWLRGERVEQGEVTSGAAAAAVAYVESHGLKKDRNSAVSPVATVPGEMTLYGHPDDERNTLRRNARGASSNGGSIDQGVGFVDGKPLPGTTSWERNAYGQFSPTSPGDGEEPDSESASYRHCHRKRMSSLTDRLALRQLISVVVLCVLFMIGEAV